MRETTLVMRIISVPIIFCAALAVAGLGGVGAAWMLHKPGALSEKVGSAGEFGTPAAIDFTKEKEAPDAMKSSDMERDSSRKEPILSNVVDRETGDWNGVGGASSNTPGVNSNGISNFESSSLGVENVGRGGGAMGAEKGNPFPAGESTNPNQSLTPPPLAATQAVARDIDIDVPFGAKIPAVFLDDTQRPAAQQAALERIMDEFQSAVQNARKKESSEETSGALTDLEVWEAARKRADHRYQILYGDSAYNRLTMSAALQALEERREGN